MRYKILLGCPISSRAWVLPHFLQHIKNISFNKQDIIIYFLANNMRDNSLEILQTFQNENKNDYLDIIIEIKNSEKFFTDERDQLIRINHTYSFLSELRNRLLSKTVELGCTHFMSIDSDVLVPKTILSDLLSANVDICSSLIYNGYLLENIEGAYKFPNVLKLENGAYKHIVNYYTKNPDKCPKDKLIEVDATGAALLISKEVCTNTSYSWHSQGEDMSWSKMCKDKGFQLFCMPHTFSHHIMSPELLQQYIDNNS